MNRTMIGLLLMGCAQPYDTGAGLRAEGSRVLVTACVDGLAEVEAQRDRVPVVQACRAGACSQVVWASGDGVLVVDCGLAETVAVVWVGW